MLVFFDGLSPDSKPPEALPIKSFKNKKTQNLRAKPFLPSSLLPLLSEKDEDDLLILTELEMGDEIDLLEELEEEEEEEEELENTLLSTSLCCPRSSVSAMCNCILLIIE